MKFEIYRDKKREWRWRAKARNGRIICVSSESYKRLNNCAKALCQIMRQSVNAPVWVVE